MKALQPLGAYECVRTQNVSCVAAAGADVLVVEKYIFSKVLFTVNLIFAPRTGLSKAILTTEDKRETFEKVLSQLTGRYGKPGLESEYDGDEERTHTTWTWRKMHGKVSLESDESDVLTVTFEPRR
jgi:hypothetical protein